MLVYGAAGHALQIGVYEIRGDISRSLYASITDNAVTNALDRKLWGKVYSFSTHVRLRPSWSMSTSVPCINSSCLHAEKTVCEAGGKY